MFYILSQPCAGEFYVILTQATVICKEGTEVEKIPLRDWPVGKPVAHFLSGCGRTQLIEVGGPGVYKKAV